MTARSSFASPSASTVSSAVEAASLFGASGASRRRQAQGGAVSSAPNRREAERMRRGPRGPAAEGRGGMTDRNADGASRLRPDDRLGTGARAPSEDAAGDAALLERFAKGDPRAARLLIERHAVRCVALANRMLGDSAEAEDVAQEAMTRLWRAASGWEDRGARISTWLHRVTLNLCYDRLRKKRGLPLDAAPEPEDPSPTAEKRLTEASLESELKAAIEELPDRQRAAIHLRHFEGRSNPEIAEALEVSVEAVESLLARGRRALKARLAPASET